MTEAEVCGSCRFWAEETHLCRRYAPLPTAAGGKSDAEELCARWLATESEEWCGDYEPVLTDEESGEEEHYEYEDEGEWAEDGSPAW